MNLIYTIRRLVLEYTLMSLFLVVSHPAVLPIFGVSQSKTTGILYSTFFCVAVVTVIAIPIRENFSKSRTKLNAHGQALVNFAMFVMTICLVSVMVYGVKGIKSPYKPLKTLPPSFYHVEQKYERSSQTSTSSSQRIQNLYFVKLSRKGMPTFEYEITGRAYEKLESGDWVSTIGSDALPLSDLEKKDYEKELLYHEGKLSFVDNTPDSWVLIGVGVFQMLLSSGFLSLAIRNNNRSKKGVSYA